MSLQELKKQGMKVICFLFKILAYLRGFSAETDLCNVICRKHTLFASGWPQPRARPHDGDLAAEGRPGPGSTPLIIEAGSAEACPEAGATAPARPERQPLSIRVEGFRAPPGPSAPFSHDRKCGILSESSCYLVIFKNSLFFFSPGSVWKVNTFLSETER